MIDIVIPLGSGSLWEDNELRYSLRSIGKNLSDFDNIVIVGERPTWLTNVIHIPAPDNGMDVTQRIFLKLLAAARNEEVSDSFLYCNDDYFFMKPTNVKDIPACYEGTLQDLPVKKKIGRDYHRAITNTIEALEKKGFPTFYYDIHVPVLMNKKKLIEVAGMFKWDSLAGYVVKSLYCNSMKVGGVEYSDAKLNHGAETEDEIDFLVGGRFVFSIGDHAINEIFKGWLEREFPNKSNFEH